MFKRTKSHINLINLGLLIITVIFFCYLSYKTTPTPNKTQLLDKYTHSQWFFPQSKRGISDGELYQTATIMLTEGAKPTEINPEAPPLVKYLFGASFLLTNRFVPLNILFYLVSSVGIFWLAKSLLKSSDQAILATLLFVTSKLVVEQLSVVMFDLAQVSFLIYFQIMLLLYYQTKNNKWLGMSGMLLGFFSATKFPLFTPPIMGIVLLCLSSLHFNNPFSLLKKAGWFLTSLVFGYTLSFAPYIISDGWQAFIDLQKWMMMFYLKGSKLAFIPGMATITVLTGIFQGWWSTAKPIMTASWSPLWPIGFFVSLQIIRKKNLEKLQWIFAGVNLILFLIFLIIPFWPRYLILILPFLIISIMQIKLKKQILYCLIVFQVVQSSLNLVFPSPNQVVDSFKHSWQIMAEDDIYELLNKKSQREISRDSFALTVNNFIEKSELTQIDLIIDQLGFFSRFTSSLATPFWATYCSSIGCWETQGELQLEKIENKWQITLNWQIIHPQFSPKTQIALTQPLQEGWLVSNDQLIGQIAQAPVVVVTPDNIISLPTITSTLESMLDTSFFNPINRFAPGKKQVIIGAIINNIPVEHIQNLNSLPGVNTECQITQFISDPNLKQFGRLTFDKHIIIDRSIPNNISLLNPNEYSYIETPNSPKTLVKNSYCHTKFDHFLTPI
ncbi:MAG: NTF2-like N-terminal transpeptidase domain-containing protein [Patescibacteria group bacterium]